MLQPRIVIASLILALLPACGPSSEAASPASGSALPAPSDASSSPSASSSGVDPAASGGTAETAQGGPARPEAAKPEPAPDAPASESASLAREFLKSGGRRIGYSAEKKGFAYPAEQRTERGFGLDVQFVGEDGAPRDKMRVCQIGECEESLDEIAKELLPKLAARLEQEGYTAIRGIGWPSGRDDLEVSTLGMKLKYTKGRFEALREGKPPAALKQAGGRKIDASTLQAIFVVPGNKILGVFAPPSADAKGLTSEFFVFKLPPG